ncbi:rhamnogalacturonan endolyase [Haloferula luteola]|uniref:rhamnogalacturonan endolyase n=1 Tax=Haloferula luteola TaxID=595692 RepID=A0A840V744_9BACT|nr:polysaccharide lyase family protein [Haloferula luteola]MBB5350568.1 rhamnogalacturonan endolyase [Haloferula luteola]
MIRPTLLLTLFTCHAVAALEVASDDRAVTLRGDAICARISKRDGRLVSLQWHGREWIRGGQGYWSITGSSERQHAGKFPDPQQVSVTADPATSHGGVARVSSECLYTGRPGTLPVNATFHYVLTPDEEGLYLYAELEHPASLPGFGLAEGRFVLKPDPELFDTIHIDARRSGLAPTGADWDAGQPANLKEARMMVTGSHAGQVEHKYGYSAVLAETPAYGWCSRREKLGLWMIHPSLESIAGGPTKPELTAHLDVNPGGRPVLLSMWHGSHYGGSALSVRKGEEWKKIVGPFLIHLNSGAEPVQLAAEAITTARREQARWPYSWVDSPLYANRDRVAVKGKIHLEDAPGAVEARSTDPAKPLWVGLTAPDYPISPRPHARIIDWQRDGKFYQYWTRADADGSFKIPHVRHGEYTLHAFREGTLGEFSRSSLRIDAPTDLGELTWIPVRSGPTVWEIGIPNRSAAEFRGGDRYWKWGNYYDYQKLFPHDVDFVVGDSDWKRDWFFCQPPRLDAHGRFTGESTWKVRFTLNEPSDCLLRIALCGFRGGGRLDLALNGQPLGTTGRFEENGVMHRDGIRGVLQTWTFPIAAEKLQDGENILELHSSARVWHEGLLYDYLRLERVDPALVAHDS